MCPFKHLALLYTFPIAVVIASPHGPEDELTASKSSVASEQPVQGIADLVGKSRRENQCFTAISALVTALVVGFLITRCFITMSSSRKHGLGVASRRLASGADQMCLEEGRDRKDRTWKILKPAIFVGAGALIAATSAGITAGIIKQDMNAATSADMSRLEGMIKQGMSRLEDQLGQLGQLGQLLPSLPAPPSLKATLRRLFPHNYEVTLKKRTFKVPLTQLNERLANCFVSLASGEAEDHAMLAKLTKFANYLISKTVGDTVVFVDDEAAAAATPRPVLDPAEVAKTIALALQQQYKERIVTMVKDMKDLKEVEDAKDIIKAAKDAVEDAKDALTTHFPDELSIAEFKLPLTELNQDVVNYYLLSFLGAKGKKELNQEDIINELESFADSFIRKMVGDTYQADLFLYENAGDAEYIALTLQQQYKERIVTMVKDKDVATAFQKTAFQKTAFQKCASYYYAAAKQHVTPTVANTVKAITEGKFKP